jgi:hypothetical protein
MIVFSGTKAHEALSSAEAFCRQVGLSLDSLQGDAVEGPIFLDVPTSCLPEQRAAIGARIAEMLA